MPFLNNIIHGVQNASRVVRHAVRATGKAIHRGAKVAYDNRDLVARGVALAAPVVTAGVAGFARGGPGGAVAGAVGAGLAEKDQIGKFVGDVKDRVKGKTKGKGIDDETAGKLIREGVKRLPGTGGNVKMDKGTRSRLKSLAQGQSV